MVSVADLGQYDLGAITGVMAPARSARFLAFFSPRRNHASLAGIQWLTVSRGCHASEKTVEVDIDPEPSGYAIQDHPVVAA
jgi:hypothetical protein